MKSYLRLLVAALVIPFFISCATTTENNRTPTQVTGHIGRSSMVYNEETTNQGLRVYCSTKNTDDRLYAFTAIPQQFNPAGRYKISIIISSNKDNSVPNLSQMTLPKEKLGSYETALEGLDYFSNNPLQIEASDSMMILNMKYNSLYKINPKTNALEQFNCIPYSYRP